MQVTLQRSQRGITRGMNRIIKGFFKVPEISRKWAVGPRGPIWS